MITIPHWIEEPWVGKLAIIPRPRGGDWLEDEVRSWRKSGLDVVVSLLTPGEISDLDLLQEKHYSRDNDLQYLSFPIVDRSVPTSRKDVLDFLKKLDKLLAEGKNVGVHCRQGIGRAALIAASLLVLAGLDTEAAFQRVSTARGYDVPETPEQKEWVAKLERLLTDSVLKQKF